MLLDFQRYPRDAQYTSNFWGTCSSERANPEIPVYDFAVVKVYLTRVSGYPYMKFVYPALSNTLAEEELSSDFVETVPVFPLVKHYLDYQPHFSHNLKFLLPS